MPGLLLALALATGAAQDPSRTVEELSKRAMKSVVVITFSDRDGKQLGLGTGFVVSPDGLIATNLHVIGEARPIQVRFADGKTFDVREIHATDRSLDLAIIRIDAKELPPLPLADEDPLPQGAPVIALGNPQGLEHSVVSGILSARRTLDGVPMLQLAIPVEEGNSGGPVMDMKGRVHGILSMKSVVSPNLGFAVDIAGLRPLLKHPNPIPMDRWLTIGRIDPKEWSIPHGAHWRLRAGRIVVTGPGDSFGGRALCISKKESPAVPYEIAVRVRLGQKEGAAGLIFGGNADHHYGFYPTDGSMRLTRFDGPTVWQWEILQTVTSPHYLPGEWNNLKVRVEKDRLACYLNGHLVIESHDTTYRDPRVGLAKFRHTDAEYDRFQVARNIPSTLPSPEVIGRVTASLKDLPGRGEIPETLIDALASDEARVSDVLRTEAREARRRADQIRNLAQAVHDRRVQNALAGEMKQPEEKINLLRAALLVARLDNAELDPGTYLKEFDAMAARAARSVPADAPEARRLEALNRVFFDDLLFHGSRTNYYSRSNSYLNEVMDDREGLPISLSVLYIELAGRLGLHVVGVPLPGHFVVRFEPKEGESRLIDVFDRGKELDRADAKRIVSNQIERVVDDGELEAMTDEALRPASKRKIVTRMLHNLTGSAGDDAARLRYVSTLLAFEPDDVSMRAARIDLAARLDRFRLALSDIDWFTRTQPDSLAVARLARLREHLEARLEADSKSR